MKCYVIIVTYNGMQWIRKCLGSVPSDYPIVVVDNASTDGTVEEIRSNYPNVSLISSEKNVGFGRANNIGISYALKDGADSVFLLNQDAYIVGKVLEELIEMQKLHPEYGILSPIHLNAEKTKLDVNFSKYIAPPNNTSFYSDFVLDQKLKDVYPVPFVNAAAWLLSKQCLEKVGGFDPLFYHYGEDDNYCQRALHHGFKIGVVPKAFVIHDRENRRKKKIIPGTDIYYEKIFLKYKIMCADINKRDGIEVLKKRINKLMLYSLAATMTFQFKENKRLYREYIGLKKLTRLIQKSRNKNKNVFANYLDL